MSLDKIKISVIGAILKSFKCPVCESDVSVDPEEGAKHLKKELTCSCGKKISISCFQMGDN